MRCRSALLNVSSFPFDLPAFRLSTAIALAACWLSAFSTTFVVSTAAFGGDDIDAERAEQYFESHVRPLLMEHCSGCHGPAEQSGGLRVDLYAALLSGGERGPALKPGDSPSSLLLQAVRRTDDLAMPPDDPLSAEQVAVLEKWINDGAYWPNRDQPLRMVHQADAEQHWAFQAVQEPAIPALADPWIRTPVDPFILQELNANDLQPSDEADRRTLIRRASFALTGLPPAESDVDEFVADSAPDAYEALVERLLASQAYGQHWGRRWLDVARYADTKGYVYAREERFWVHAWTYRDWVINALNEDMPYDRFLLLQLAADQVSARRQDYAAMGFLTLGRRFLGVQRDIIDDRIDVVSRATLGLTVACARCHDHKYDPIPTEDYYSLYGVFASCNEQLVPLVDAWDDADFAAELEKRQTALADKLVEARRQSAERARQRVADYLVAQTELHKYPPAGFDQIFAPTDLLPALVHRWEAYLRKAAKDQETIFHAWRLYHSLWQSLASKDDFASAAAVVTQRIHAEADQHHPLIVAAFARSADISTSQTRPINSIRDVAERYGQVFAEIELRWVTQLKESEQTDAPEPAGFEDATSEQLRQVLYAVDSPCVAPVGPVVSTEFYFDTATIDQLWKLQREVDRWILNAPTPAPHALMLADADVPHEPRVFLRGNPSMQGENVPRRFLEALSENERAMFNHGSGRLELAERIVDPNNPLTARVIVNRVWASYFGTGLVTTPSDFGLRAAPPSHPELLDWLAANLMQNGWSLKQLHRWIVLSSTFRQSSQPGDSNCNERAEQSDPTNRLLWKMTPRRLSFEEFRDALLSAGGDLDISGGGRPKDLFTSPYTPRRTIYGLVDRQFLPATLRVFDFANPDLHVANRSETTVPGQALFFLNHPWMLDRARQLAANFSQVAEPQERIEQMWHRVYQRRPEHGELSQALAFIDGTTAVDKPVRRPTAEDWKYGFGRVDEQAQRVDGFQQLPHFTGEAWQGSEAYPDAILGWVQLTARGGHPGNDLQHASVRRWTSPQRQTIGLHSQLVHEPAAGDGIRAFVVHSRLGILASTNLHQAKQTIDLESVEMEQGEWLDFVVDIGQVLNSDQYLWQLEIAGTQASTATDNWNSLADFTADRARLLDPWEQLAQVMLSSNEFLFVD